MKELAIRPAVPEDKTELTNLLQQSDLPVEDLTENLHGFLVAVVDGQIVGTVGIEAYQKWGLLRSLAVTADFQSRQIGSRLFEAALELARSKGIENLYLLTTTASEYFARKGFHEVCRKDVPAAIRATQQFSRICPDSAIVMHKALL